MKVEDGKIRPNTSITREEAAYAVATAYHISQEGEMRFKDADSMSEWAQKEINALALQGYLRGYEDGTKVSAKALGYLSTVSDGVSVETQRPVLINEKTMQVTVKLYELKEQANFRFFISQELLINAQDRILTETITVEKDTEPEAVR